MVDIIPFVLLHVRETPGMEYVATSQYNTIGIGIFFKGFETHWTLGNWVACVVLTIGNIPSKFSIVWSMICLTRYAVAM